jgi:hypothetical protein
MGTVRFVLESWGWYWFWVGVFVGGLSTNWLWRHVARRIDARLDRIQAELDRRANEGEEWKQA